MNSQASNGILRYNYISISLIYCCYKILSIKLWIVKQRLQPKKTHFWRYKWYKWTFSIIFHLIGNAYLILNDQNNILIEVLRYLGFSNFKIWLVYNQLVKFGSISFVLYEGNLLFEAMIHYEKKIFLI